MKVADVMSRPAYLCSPTETLARAAQIMWDRDVGVVPVVDREGRAIAMITDRDICMAAYTQERALSEICVQQAMSKVIYTCHPEDKLTTAERTMRVHQVRRLPVVDDAGRLLGVLAISDICRARAQSPLSGLTSDLLATLAAIGKPRTSQPAAPAAGLAPSEQKPVAPPVRRHAQRETESLPSTPRMPPQPIRDPSSLFRF